MTQPRRRALPKRACMTAGQAHRPAPTRLRCWARPAAAKACWRWIRTTRSCSPRVRRAAPEDRWFEQLGAHVADILHEVGVPYCKGGVMAKNPQWRGSLATWRDRVADWIRHSQPGGSAVGRHLLRHARACTATRALCGDAVARGFRRRAAATPPSPSCWPKRPARWRRRSDWFGAVQDRGWPHRSEEGRAVRHRLDRARARDPPSCRGARDARAARRRQGARHRWRKRSRRTDRCAGGVPRPASRPADPG